MNKLTTSFGAPVADDNNTITAGPRGPALLQDVWFLEKLAHFDREVIPERRMHAKGAGAFGAFTVTHDITRYTRAKIFSEVGKKTEMMVRFSTVAGERGAADAERDIRGFAMKFYTEEGNWDLVGNNTPIFFIRDPLKFPDLNHAVKRDPRTGMRSAENNWDFWTNLPEALHQITIVMSDRGIPKSWRHMHGFGSHTYSFINSGNERFWVKFHFRTQQGVENLTDEEATDLIGRDRESSQRDLFENIEAGNYPRWTLFVQIMPEEQANTYRINPFNITKVWPKADYPLIEVGVMELNRNPENFFAEIEQAAFAPSSIIPGIGFSPDKLLQGRLFRMATHSDIASALISPRSLSMLRNARSIATTGTVPCAWMATAVAPDLTSPTAMVNGQHSPIFRSRHFDGAAARWDHRADDDYYSQPGDLFRLMTAGQQKVLFENTARAIYGATERTIQRHIDNCSKADPDYGAGVAEAVKRIHRVKETPNPVTNAAE